MNGVKLFEQVKQSSTFDELLQSEKDSSKRGRMFEIVSNIIIRFGFCPIFSNDIYDHYEGNINIFDIKKVYDLTQYLKELTSTKSGSSDITLKNKITGEYVFISCKFCADDSNNSIKYYEIQDIQAAILKNSYEYKNYKIYLFVNNKQKVLKLVNSSEETNKNLKKDITDIIGIDDLELYFQKLKSAIQYISIDEVNSKFGNEKIPLDPYFHQDMITHIMIICIEAGNKNLLLGAKPRSGKTICVGVLFKKSYNKFLSLNALIITPAPNETLSQFTDDMFHKFRDFIGINIVEIRKGSDFDSMILQNNNIIIVSKQLLDDYVFEKRVDAIQQLNLDFIIFDENHYHGTTQMSKNIFDSYSTQKTVNVFLTATYAKPLNEWNIPMDCQFYWDIEDEQMCKKRNIQGLKEKHGEYVSLFLNEKNMESKLSVYDNMPELHIITTMMDQRRYAEIKERIKDTSYGFSNSTLLSTTSIVKEKQMNKNGKEKLVVIGGGENFNYAEEVDNILKYISGDGTIDETECVIRDKMSIFERIKTISRNSNSRTNLNNGDFTSQLWFLPFGQDMLIDKVSECLKERMLKNRVLNKYDILIVNSKTDYKLKDIKTKIKNRESEAKESGKNGLIILAGNQLTLGITLPFVDIVILLNDTVSSDRIIQMMYRCMTERINNDENNKINSGNKKMGFVVDLNISRVLNTCLDFNIYNKNLNLEQKMAYMIENNLINIDSDLFQSKENKTKLVEKLLDIWKADPINNLKILLRKIEDNIILLDTQDQKMSNKYFTSSIGENRANVTVNFDDEINQPMSNGKTRTSKDNDNDNADNNDDNENDEENNISISKDVLPFVIPFTCILTIFTDDKDIIDMINIIISNPDLLEIFNDQTFIWWGKSDVIRFVKFIIDKYVKKNSFIYNIAIQFKMSLQSLIDKPKELLEFIDSCLKPKAVEKKKFGEVFTPMSFVDKMLCDLELDFKQKYNKNIFEDENLKWGDTTAGMGNFPIAIYYKLMDGLKNKIPNEKERKRHILENMLYMAEISKKNCFIIKQIFDINNEYKLNLYQGDSLQLDIKKQFGIDKFNIIIGNPPYNDEFKGKNGYARPIYNKFTEYYIDKCDILSFVIPSRWFSGGRGLDGFRKKMLSRTDIAYIKHFDDACKIFGNSVDIKGGVHYFLKDINYSGQCDYNNVMMNLNDCDILIDSKYLPLIDRLDNFPRLNDCYRPKAQFDIPLNKEYFSENLHDNKEKEDIRCFVSQKNGSIKYIKKTKIKESKLGKWQIITPSAAHGAYSGFANLILGKPDDVYSETYISFSVQTEQEANSLLSYMKCRLPNMLLSIRKISQNISKETCKWIPMPPLNRIWTDDEVYKHFNLLQEDIELINNTTINNYKDCEKPTVINRDNRIEIIRNIKIRIKPTIKP